MKAIFSLFAILALTTGLASAQSSTHYTHSYSSSSYESSRYQWDDGRPIIGGVFVDTVRYGWVLVSPGAPEKYGHGEKYVTAPVGTLMPHYVSNPSGIREVDRMEGAKEARTAGGIVFFSLSF